MHRFDPDDARKFVPTMEECAEIYNRMGLGLAEAFSYLNPYLQERLDDYGLEAKDLYVCGFSQGAMVAIYVSLMQDEKIGGCISFSGIITPHSYLLKHARTAPDTLLIHGNEDNLCGRKLWHLPNASCSKSAVMSKPALSPADSTALPKKGCFAPLVLSIRILQKSLRFEHSAVFDEAAAVSLQL